MKDLNCILVESLLDMDEESADKVVINSVVKKIIKRFNQYNPYSSKFNYFDAMGREAKIGDIILTDNMELGQIIGFGEMDTVFFSTDGEQHDDFDDFGVSNIKCGYFIKIPNIKLLKELLK